MDGLTAKFYTSAKRYWRTRRYHRIRTTGQHSDQQERRRGPFWRFRLNRRLKLKLPRSPRKMFMGLRDAYVNVMMKLASTQVVRGRTVSGYNGDGFGKMVAKEYDEKVIVEICRDLAMRRNYEDQIASQIACSG